MTTLAIRTKLFDYIFSANDKKIKEIKIYLSVIFILPFLFFSCSKNPGKALIQKNGVWNYSVTETTTNSANNDVRTNGPYLGTVHFTKSNYNKNDIYGYLIDEGTWSYDKSKSTLTFFTNTGDIYTEKVSEAKRKSETWDETRTVVSFNVTYTTKRVYKLTKN